MGGDALKSIHGLCAGVFDALHKKYLRTLFLTICGARDGPLIEEYICKRSLDFKALLRIIIHLLLVMYIIALHKRHSTVAGARMELERGCQSHLADMSLADTIFCSPTEAYLEQFY